MCYSTNTMSKLEIPPTLDHLIQRLGGTYPGAPGNEILPDFLLELSPKDIAKLFADTFALFKASVEFEHVSALIDQQFGHSIGTSHDTVHLGHIADTLAGYLQTKGARMDIAIRAQALAVTLSYPKGAEIIDKHAHQFDEYYRFYLNQERMPDKQTLSLGFSGEGGRALLFHRDVGQIAYLDIRDIYLTRIEF